MDGEVGKGDFVSGIAGCPWKGRSSRPSWKRDEDASSERLGKGSNDAAARRSGTLGLRGVWSRVGETWRVGTGAGTGDVGVARPSSYRTKWYGKSSSLISRRVRGLGLGDWRKSGVDWEESRLNRPGEAISTTLGMETILGLPAGLKTTACARSHRCSIWPHVFASRSGIKAGGRDTGLDGPSVNERLLKVSAESEGETASSSES